MCYYCMSGRLLVAGALASRRLARPVLVAAPSGWPSASPLAARGSPPGLVFAVGSPPPGAAGRRFCGSAGGFRAVAVLRPLARCRPRPRSPAAPSLAASPRPWRAAARLCSPSAPLRCAAGCARAPSRLLRCACWALVPAPAGPPLPPGWRCLSGPRSRLPRRGLSARCAGLGGLRSAPPPGGGFGALRRAALLRRAGRLPASSSQENASWGLTPCKNRGKMMLRMVQAPSQSYSDHSRPLRGRGRAVRLSACTTPAGGFFAAQSTYPLGRGYRGPPAVSVSGSGARRADELQR